MGDLEKIRGFDFNFVVNLMGKAHGQILRPLTKILVRTE